MRSVEAGRRLAAGFARGLGAYRQRPDRPGLGEAVLSFFYTPPRARHWFLEAMKHLRRVPFRFCLNGSRVIHFTDERPNDSGPAYSRRSVCLAGLR